MDMFAKEEKRDSFHSTKSHLRFMTVYFLVLDFFICSLHHPFSNIAATMHNLVHSTTKGRFAQA